MQNILVLDTASFLPKERGKSDFIPNYVGSEPGLHLPCTITLPLFPVAHQICLFTAMQKLWTNTSKLLCVFFPPTGCTYSFIWNESQREAQREREGEREKEQQRRKRENLPSVSSAPAVQSSRDWAWRRTGAWMPKQVVQLGSRDPSTRAPFPGPQAEVASEQIVGTWIRESDPESQAAQHTPKLCNFGLHAAISVCSSLISEIRMITMFPIL